MRSIKRGGHILVRKIGSDDTLTNINVQESSYNNNLCIDQHGENIIFLNNNETYLLQTNTNKIRDLKIPEGQRIALSRNGKILAHLHDDYFVDFYHPLADSILQFTKLSATFKITAIDLNADGKLICLGGENGQIQVFDVASSKMVSTLNSSSKCN